MEEQFTATLQKSPNKGGWTGAHRGLSRLRSRS